ncbi:MAG: hypothetical protein ACE15B_03785 [Bryobacteraceae bacterium]
MHTRRRFLESALAAAAAPGNALPQVRLGRYSISRLVCGANPFNGGSHLSKFFNQQLKEYYTPERILKTLRRCQEVGINCWQSSGANVDLYKRLIAEGGKMHYISLGSGDGSDIAPLAAAGTIAIAHHGEFTDRCYKQGKLGEVRDYVKRVRDAGLVAGVSTHMPAVVDTVESQGWDLDFYMTCVYERHRSAADLANLLGGHVPVQIGEVYLSSDPPRMYKAIRQTKRTCLAFKILAAGRLSDRPEWVERAFREAYAGIKPTDAVIIGIYDRYSDQPGEDAAFTRRFGA